MPITPAVRGRIADTRIELIENTAIQLGGKDDFVREIAKLWTDAHHKFVLIGRYLKQAKATLPHGEYEAMIAGELPFGRAVAHQLRTVADVVESGVLPIDRLPPNYSTVYQITTLTGLEREQALENQVIRPNVTRAELIAFKRQMRTITTDKHAALLRERERLIAQQTRIAERLKEIDQELGGG